MVDVFDFGLYGGLFVAYDARSGSSAHDFEIAGGDFYGFIAAAVGIEVYEICAGNTEITYFLRNDCEVGTICACHICA